MSQVSPSCILDIGGCTFTDVERTINFVNGELQLIPKDKNPCSVCSTPTHSYLDPCKHALCKECGEKLFTVESKKDHHYNKFTFDGESYKNVVVKCHDCPKCNSIVINRKIVMLSV